MTIERKIHLIMSIALPESPGATHLVRVNSRSLVHEGVGMTAEATRGVQTMVVTPRRTRKARKGHEGSRHARPLTRVRPSW